MPSDLLPSVLVVLGLAGGTIVAVSARAPREGLRCLLDFLLAAGLLRLTRPDTGTGLLVAAATVVVRQVAGRGVDTARAARHPPPTTHHART